MTNNYPPHGGGPMNGPGQGGAPSARPPQPGNQGHFHAGHHPQAVQQPGQGGPHQQMARQPMPQASAPRPQVQADISVASKIINESGRLRTARGEDLDLERIDKAVLRDMVALFDNGVLFMADNMARQTEVMNYVTYLTRVANVQVSERRMVPLPLIVEIYRTYEHSRHGRAGGGEKLVDKQREIIDVLREAAEYGASDVHVEVDGAATRIDYRLDGLLWHAQHLAKTSNDGRDFIAAVHAMGDKGAMSEGTYNDTSLIMGRLSRQKTALPGDVQAVRLQFNPAGSGGAYLVMRLLYKLKSTDGDIGALGYLKSHLEKLCYVAAKAEGVTLITGPTGSGKSTSLERLLRSIQKSNNRSKNAVSVEDPIEYDIEGVRQIPCAFGKDSDERAENMAQALEAVLRDDPDIIMVGEVRGLRVAQLMIQASITGHSVLSTLHTNDTVSCIGRLAGMGLPGWQVFDSETFNAFVAQRLVRTLCPHCRIPLGEALRKGLVDRGLFDRMSRVVEDLTAWPIHIASPSGCSHCGRKRGYGPRTTIAELLLPDDEFMSLMEAGQRVKAREHWYASECGTTMMDHALAKLRAGIVDPAEIERVLRPLDWPTGRSSRVIDLSDLSEDLLKWEVAA